MFHFTKHWGFFCFLFSIKTYFFFVCFKQKSKWKGKKRESVCECVTRTAAQWWQLTLDMSFRKGSVVCAEYFYSIFSYHMFVCSDSNKHNSLWPWQFTPLIFFSPQSLRSHSLKGGQRLKCMQVSLWQCASAVKLWLDCCAFQCLRYGVCVCVCVCVLWKKEVCLSEWCVHLDSHAFPFINQVGKGKKEPVTRYHLCSLLLPLFSNLHFSFLLFFPPFPQSKHTTHGRRRLSPQRANVPCQLGLVISFIYGCHSLLVFIIISSIYVIIIHSGVECQQQQQHRKHTGGGGETCNSSAMQYCRHCCWMWPHSIIHNNINSINNNSNAPVTSCTFGNVFIIIIITFTVTVNDIVYTIDSCCIVHFTGSGLSCSILAERVCRDEQKI